MLEALGLILALQKQWPDHVGSCNDFDVYPGMSLEAAGMAGFQPWISLAGEGKEQKQ
jgi:hypothetical protein